LAQSKPLQIHRVSPIRIFGFSERLKDFYLILAVSDLIFYLK
jgi:hypothetical protein